MATGDTPDSLDLWLHRATDPNNEADRWDCIQGFYQLVNKEADGPQVAIRLLAHKIQSPQEKEALQALTVLEACMNHCGPKFQSEAAKFRFLNELIKLLKPEHFGKWTPQTVKDRVTEVLFSWTLKLKDQPKIKEAYAMLKDQGLIKEDPKLPAAPIMAPPTQRSTESVLDQEQAMLLDRLLKSPRAEDLEFANRLIKSTVKERQEKEAKALKRESALKEVESSSRELRDLLEQHSLTGGWLPPTDHMKAVYERCERQRPSLFRLASDTMEDDAALAQVLAANDDLTLAVNAYKDQTARRESNGEGRSRSASREEEEEEARRKSSAPQSPREVKSYHLIDLSALDSPETLRNAETPPPSDSAPPRCGPALLRCSSAPHDDSFSPAAAAELHSAEPDLTDPSVTCVKSYFEELMQLDKDVERKQSEQNGGRGVVLRARGCGGNDVSASNGTNSCSFPPNGRVTSSPSTNQSQSAESAEPACSPLSLKNIFVPMDDVKPSHLEPITLLDEGGVRVCFHFAVNSPASQLGVAVVVVSTLNTSTLHVTDFLLQVAVSKSMLVKLQPASGTRLPPYNPLLPPPAISQLLLLANPQKCKVRIRYKLTLMHGDRRLNKMGDIDNFPDWSSLVVH